MHACLRVDEILRLIACELVGSEAKATAVSLACCCKGFEDPALDALWDTQDLFMLLKSLPGDVWEEEHRTFSFKRIPTKAEWAHFRKHTRRIRELKMDTSGDAVLPDVLLALQLRTANEHLLPRMKIFKCLEPDEGFIPFIPLFLSPNTTDVEIVFVYGTPTVMVASIISRLSTLCPDLESIILNPLPRDLVITDAASEMLLGCNRDTLRCFLVDSPLTEEAREVVYRLPKLASLMSIVQGPTSLPPVALPNLTLIDLEYDDHLGWLQGFRGAVLEKLDLACFRSETKQIGDFLGAFESVALTTSAPATLSKLKVYTMQSWNPNYRSLLRFTQLTHLVIEFSCHNVCSSTINDDIIISLAQAIPGLEILRLGKMPCPTPTGVTIKGLVALACGCLRLSKLRIHFEAASLVNATTGVEAPSPSGDGSMVRREDCGLTVLEVGYIPIPPECTLMVSSTLLQIFPRLLNIEYHEGGWESIVESIKLSRRIGSFIQDTRDTVNVENPGDGRA